MYSTCPRVGRPGHDEADRSRLVARARGLGERLRRRAPRLVAGQRARARGARGDSPTEARPAVPGPRPPKRRGCLQGRRCPARERPAGRPAQERHGKPPLLRLLRRAAELVPETASVQARYGHALEGKPLRANQLLGRRATGGAPSRLDTALRSRWLQGARSRPRRRRRAASSFRPCRSRARAPSS